MKDVEDLIKQIIKKAKDKQALYFYGVEYSSTSDPDYRARIKFSKDGVPPLLAGGKSKAKLKQQLQRYLDGESVKDIAIQYCYAQIHIEKQAIKFHLDLINDYKEDKNGQPLQKDS